MTAPVGKVYGVTEYDEGDGVRRFYDIGGDAFFGLDGVNGKTLMLAKLDFTGIAPVAADTDGAVIKAGTTASPIASSAANQSMVRLVFDFDHDGGYGLYTRSYISTAAVSADAARVFGTVNNVAAATARGAHISLSFGATGTVSGLGVALECTLHIPDQGTQAGTMAPLKLAINSDGDDSDPSGAVLSYIRVDNQGNANGIADVDDDAFLFDIQGHTIADDNMVDAAATAFDGSDFTHGIKVRVGATTMWLVASTTNPKST